MLWRARTARHGLYNEHWELCSARRAAVQPGQWPTHVDEEIVGERWRTGEDGREPGRFD